MWTKRIHYLTEVFGKNTEEAYIKGQSALFTLIMKIKD